MIARVTRRQRQKRIVILGGGFGGVYAAIHLERLLARESAVEICLVSHDNFFLFTPMLHEVAASDLEVTNIVNPLRKLLHKVEVLVGDVQPDRSICQASLDFEQLSQSPTTNRL
jgi:NADH dehydrogenase FAD-containing subunit